jgi:hypothetical protein
MLNYVVACATKLKKLIAQIDRNIRYWLYKRAMLNAIRKAAGKGCSMTAGLRVIKTFESVNNLRFSSFDSVHLLYVQNMGSHERFFIRSRKLLDGKS